MVDGDTICILEMGNIITETYDLEDNMTDIFEFYYWYLVGRNGNDKLIMMFDDDVIVYKLVRVDNNLLIVAHQLTL